MTPEGPLSPSSSLKTPADAGPPASTAGPSTVDQVFAHVALLVGALAVLGVGVADLWLFHELERQMGAAVDLGMILAGAAGLGVQVTGVLPRSSP